MKVVRQARLELSGGSTPDQLSPPPPPPPPPLGAIFFAPTSVPQSDQHDEISSHICRGPEAPTPPLAGPLTHSPPPPLKVARTREGVGLWPNAPPPPPWWAYREAGISGGDDFVGKSPRREVVRSSAGAGIVYPPFLGSFA